MVPGLSSGNAHVGLEVVDGMFHNGPDPVGSIPFIGITLDTGKHAQFHVFISVCCPAFFGGAAGMSASAVPLVFFVLHSGASPFDTVCPPFFFCHTMVFHGEGRVVGAGGIAVFIVTDFFKCAFIPRIVGNQGFGEMEIMEQGAIKSSGIKSGIAQKDIRVKTGMQGEIIGKHGNQGRSVTHGLIIIGRIRFLFGNQSGMEKIFWRTSAERKPSRG